PEAIADPNLLKRGAIGTTDDGRKHFAPAVRFRDEPSQPLYREPLLGEHTHEILRGTQPRPTPRDPLLRSPATSCRPTAPRRVSPSSRRRLSATVASVR